MQTFFFAERVVEPWNSLVAQPSDFKSLAAFEKCIGQNASNLGKFLIINLENKYSVVYILYN
jgi:hypothetical protein